MKRIKQFEIYQVNLEPRKGSEQVGKRPCVVLQTNAVGHIAQVFLVAPLTSKQLEKVYPYQVLVNRSKSNGLKCDSKIKFEQLRIIDRVRIGKKLGQLEIDYQPAVFQAIDVMIDRFGDFR
ncbi:type II toxin-antitoxin system PemK/MazF family toxin [Patescibacteria group bacterium]|nr:type II toxin-antitoxin system PemK/MazF family toxin [Patescibacteria group bacterium]MBU1016104.1 type II toxin-antitoxin system PemK/MazF family toxin [Patescibacteria group bacterium]MBU1684847.1 type II toxin-antitoxin system PemK/MazF family toxin [Patescibacteria group bacterium]MBU1938563.1 type II toxin-antitoxin system PemK/MazF family toxin [Patescibacteria group bacterium]